MTEIVRWSAVETAQNIRNRKVGVGEVVSAHLERLEAINPRINAITEIAPDCLDLAHALDAKRPKGDLPPLYGVPVTTKINVDQAGYGNSNGIPAFAENICDQDSAVVANLKTAGAIVIGRTNTPEFSMRWCTSNPLYGVTKNPWNDAITPGGSSGGAAAAVASGIGTIAHGNDLGGSLRYPAFCCGVTAIRPSLGRVPAYNPGAAVERPPVTQLMSVQGPIARSVSDLRLGLRAMAQRSSHDPLWTAAPDSGRLRDGKVKVGYCVNPFSAPIDPALEQAMQTACDGLRAAGHEVVEHVPPQADQAARLWGEMLFTETLHLMGETIHSVGSPEMVRLLQGYREIFGSRDLAGFLQGLSERRALQRAWAEMFDQIDLLLMPTSLMRPYENDLDFKDPSALPGIVAAHGPLFVVNLLGLPSVAVPTGLANGCPVGVQLVGPMHDDFFAIDIAETLETQVGRIVDALDLP